MNSDITSQLDDAKLPQKHNVLKTNLRPLRWPLYVNKPPEKLRPDLGKKTLGMKLQPDQWKVSMVDAHYFPRTVESMTPSVDFKLIRNAVGAND